MSSLIFATSFNSHMKFAHNNVNAGCRRDDANCDANLNENPANISSLSLSMLAEKHRTKVNKNKLLLCFCQRNKYKYYGISAIVSVHGIASNDVPKRIDNKEYVFKSVCPFTTTDIQCLYISHTVGVGDNHMTNLKLITNT